ncbi:MAG TPA: hypothetical protein VF766_00315 [Pyrinomonadaceae bacterium]
MKNKKARLYLLVVVLALTAQLSIITPSVQAQNSSDTGMMQTNRSDRWCGRRCNTNYRRCVRSRRNPRACRAQLRNCLRRCSR